MSRKDVAKTRKPPVRRPCDTALINYMATVRLNRLPKVNRDLATIERIRQEEAHFFFYGNREG